MDFMSRHLAYEREQREIAVDGYCFLAGAIAGLVLGLMMSVFVS